MAVADAKLWSPQSPHLYDLEISLVDPNGNVVDRVHSYAGIRSVGFVQQHVIFLAPFGPVDNQWGADAGSAEQLELFMADIVGFASSGVLVSRGFDLVA